MAVAALGEGWSPKLAGGLRSQWGVADQSTVCWWYPVPCSEWDSVVGNSVGASLGDERDAPGGSGGSCPQHRRIPGGTDLGAGMLFHRLSAGTGESRSLERKFLEIRGS